MDRNELLGLLYKIGFHKRKVANIREVTALLVEEFEGKIPNDYMTLIEMPGIGGKMAKQLLNLAFNSPVGVSVDAHMHRIANRL